MQFAVPLYLFGADHASVYCYGGGSQPLCLLQFVLVPLLCPRLQQCLSLLFVQVRTKKKILGAPCLSTIIININNRFDTHDM